LLWVQWACVVLTNSGEESQKHVRNDWEKQGNRETGKPNVMKTNMMG